MVHSELKALVLTNGNAVLEDCEPLIACVSDFAVILQNRLELAALTWGLAVAVEETFEQGLYTIFLCGY